MLLPFRSRLSSLRSSLISRQFDRHLAPCLLGTVHHLLLVALASRQFLNLVHWLPLLVAVQRAVLCNGQDPGQEVERVHANGDVGGLCVRGEDGQGANGSALTTNKINSAIRATSDIFLYWSYLKLPPRIIIITSVLPFAISLFAITFINRSGRKAGLQRERMLIATPLLLTILLVGTQLLQTQKLDSYSFMHLVIALGLDTLLLHPGWNGVAQRVLGPAYEKLSGLVGPQLRGMASKVAQVGSLLDRSRFPLIRLIPRYISLLVARLSTAHFATTLIIYIVDGASQWPKRWSFLSPRCWGFGVGVLVVRGFMVVVAKSDEEHGPPREDYSRLQPEVTEDAERRACIQRRERPVIALGARYGVGALLAMMVIAATSSNIDISVSSVTHFEHLSANTVTASYLGVIAFAWGLLGLFSHGVGAAEVEATCREVDLAAEDGDEGTSTSVEQRGIGRWLAMLLLALAVVPSLMASMKHAVSGTMLAAVYDRIDEIITKPNTLVAVTNGPRSLGASRYRSDQASSLFVDIPSVDVVIAYYNEPTAGVRKLVSRIRSELTWAHVEVIIYHKGIPGFGFDGELASANVTAVIEDLRSQTGADLVIPRKNLGRDMGVYLNHIVGRWDELAQQTIFLQAQPHEMNLVWQKLRLLNPAVGFMSFGEYQLYANSIDLGNGWPFPELSIAWDKFYPDQPLQADSPILITWKGEIVLSSERIKNKSLEVWTDIRDVLLSEVNDEEHVGGFNWNGDEGPVSPYFGHIVERAWPLMAGCYSSSLYHECQKYWWSDNANGGCLCGDVHDVVRTR